jgi:DNA (cytosine-5)-methyltransferase 1
VYHRVLNAKHYGVPQNRPRIFIVGFGEPIRFRWPEPSPKDPPRVGDALERDPPAKYYLSQRYLESLKRHRERHQSLGNGFGYMLLDPDGVAHTLVIGGMGHERNLVKGVPPPNAYAGPGDDPSKPNSEGIRRLTPIECARLQGFPNPHKIPPLRKLPPEELQRLRARGGFLFPVSDTQIYRQTAESVAVPLVRRIAEQMRVAMEERSPLLGEEA